MVNKTLFTICHVQFIYEYVAKVMQWKHVLQGKGLITARCWQPFPRKLKIQYTSFSDRMITAEMSHVYHIAPAIVFFTRH